MRRVAAAVLVGVILGLSLPSATSQPALGGRRTVFSALKPGQAVTVREKGDLWEISVLQGEAPTGHKVTEVGGDFIVVTDDEGLIETSIPVTAIRAVKVIKTKPR